MFCQRKFDDTFQNVKFGIFDPFCKICLIVQHFVPFVQNFQFRFFLMKLKLTQSSTWNVQVRVNWEDKKQLRESEGGDSIKYYWYMILFLSSLVKSTTWNLVQKTVCIILLNDNDSETVTQKRGWPGDSEVLNYNDNNFSLSYSETYSSLASILLQSGWIKCIELALLLVMLEMLSWCTWWLRFRSRLGATWKAWLGFPAAASSIISISFCR